MMQHSQKCPPRSPSTPRDFTSLSLNVFPFLRLLVNFHFCHPACPFRSSRQIPPDYFNARPFLKTGNLGVTSLYMGHGGEKRKTK